MIAPMKVRDVRGALAMGDEPEDLARGRLLYELEILRAGEPPKLRFPAKGLPAPPTTLDGVDAEQLLAEARGRIPHRSEWLLDLATVAETDELGPLASGGASLTALREATVLLAAARRSAAHDLAYAFERLGESPEAFRNDARLRAFREETNRAVGPALKVRPRFAWRVALVAFHSAESVEEIVAARWRDQLRNYVVLAANGSYVAGRTTFAFRSPEGLSGAEILGAAFPAAGLRAPPVRYTGGGRDGRGSLRHEAFAALLRALRFRRPEEIAP